VMSARNPQKPHWLKEPSVLFGVRSWFTIDLMVGGKQRYVQLYVG